MLLRRMSAGVDPRPARSSTGTLISCRPDINCRRGLALRELELARVHALICSASGSQWPLALPPGEHATSARLDLLSTAKQRSSALTWILTVCGDRSSSRAISLLEYPLSSRPSTPFYLGVKRR